MPRTKMAMSGKNKQQPPQKPLQQKANAVKVEEKPIENKATSTEFRPKKILWRKIGGGQYTHITGEKFRRGQTFLATIDEIPKAFRDTIVPADSTTLAPVEEEPLEVIAVQYTKQEVPPESGNFQVVDSKGKVVSEGDLTETEADDFILSLQS